MIATVDYHHLYYKDYWLAPSKANLNGYTLEISPAPMYYVYMAFLLAEIMTTIGIIISSYCSQRSMPNKGKIHFLMIAAMLSPMLLLSLRILKILKGDDPTPLGILLSCIFMSIAVVKYGLFDPVKNAKNYIIDNLKEAVIVTDADHRFLFLNSMADKIITSINKEQGYSTDDKIYAFIQGSQDFFDWKDRHYQVEETVLKDNELIQGYMMTIVDVTKIIEQNHLMKRLVLQTEDANRAKTNFVSNMSHEIRTPMNSIVGITEILLRSRHSPKEQEYLLNIQSSGRVLLTIINDVLDCSKMEAGKMQLFDEPYDTCSLFHDLRISMENRIGHSGLELIYDIDQDIPCKLKGDMGRIRQVIINLVNNAIKYTEKGSVRFSVHVRQKNTDKVMLYYEVADTGIGIRKEDQKILFDAFQRVEMDRNLIIVVNDNGMSIAENHGGIYKNLELLRQTGGKAECNLFRAMGLDYVFQPEGNNTDALIETFQQVKDCDHPVVVHIVTEKGKGYAPAETHKENWHWCMPFDPKTGKSTVHFEGEDYGDLTARYLLQEMQKDPKVVAITSGTPTVFGFTEDLRKQAGKQFMDVGIAEETAVALASGLAAGGAKPVYGVYSSFLQRTYDQLSQDLCINNNPATLLVFAASVYGMNDVTHLGIFDIPMISNIPNLVYLAPTTKEEYFAMLHWSMNQREHPVAIRVPACGVLSDGKAVTKDFGKLNTYEVTQAGSDVAFIGLGSFYPLAQQAAAEYEKRTGVRPTVINPYYITGLDKELLAQLGKTYKAVVTLEDGVLDGGFGQKIAAYYGGTDTKVLCYGLQKEFLDRYDVQAVLEENRLTAAQISDDLQNL